MSNAATHILFAIILIELFREFVIKDNKKFPRYYILVAVIGGILPDLDFIFVYVLYPFGFLPEVLHRTFLHSLLVPLVLLLIGILVWKLGIQYSSIGKRHMTLPGIFFILSAGSFLHLFLDWFFVGIIMPFYPFNSFAMDFNVVRFFPEILQKYIEPTLDGILLLFWIFWMEFKLKITDYF